MTVYLLHFSHRYYHAGHYLGSARSVKKRKAQHDAGHGSPLVRALIADGGSTVLVRTWRGMRRQEAALKRRHNSPALCPICSARSSAS
jgi:hypothetical protein